MPDKLSQEPWAEALISGCDRHPEVPVTNKRWVFIFFGKNHKQEGHGGPGSLT